MPGIGLIVKRTISFSGGGAEPPSIVEEAIFDDEVLIDEPDVLAPHKPCTDVIVTGSVYSATPVAHIDAEVRMGAARRSVRVHGERRIRVRGGDVQYEAVAPIREAPLTFRAAYGGSFGGDPRPRRPRFGAANVFEPDPNRWSYPRNPAGIGFVTRDHVQSLDGALAPSQEDPEDPATADRLVVATPQDWARAPVPGGLGPLPMSCFPRAHWLVPFSADLDGTSLREIALGAMARGDTDRKFGPVDARVLSCAVPGLAAVLDGSEPIHLRGFRWAPRSLSLGENARAPHARFHFVGGGTFDPPVTLKTVHIRVDQEEVTLLWGAFQPTARAYGPDDLEGVRVELKERQP